MSSEGLTISQAVEELSAPGPVQAEENTQAQPQQAAEQPEPEQPAATVADGSEAEEPGDAENQEQEPEAEAIKLEPPKWWSKDKKEQFAKLPPDLQAVVFEQEEVRERVVSKAKQESAEARKAADAHATALQQRIQQLDSILPTAIQTYRDRWANVDWQRLATEVDPQTYNQYRAAYENESRQVAGLQEQAQKAQAENLRRFDAEQAEKLKVAAPDLADEKLGSQRKQELANFLAASNLTPQQVRFMTAEMAGLAYDAMRWRKAQSEMAARAKTQPKPAQPVTPVRPTPPASRTPTEAKLKAAQEAFDRNPSVKNLEALERLRAN